MKELRMLLADAIEQYIKAERTILRMKIVIGALLIFCIFLIIGYFV